MKYILIIKADKKADVQNFKPRKITFNALGDALKTMTDYRNTWGDKLVYYIEHIAA